jgi:hypothetical protein
MAQRLWYGAAVVVSSAVAGVAMAACGSTPAPHGPQAPPAAPKAAAVTATAKPMPYDLYTHCGIDEALIGDRYFVAVRPLSDGAGNPPAGWGNPYQAGTMTLVSPTEAVFTDKAGHRVVFRLRPGAKSFLRVCS